MTSLPVPLRVPQNHSHPPSMPPHPSLLSVVYGGGKGQRQDITVPSLCFVFQMHVFEGGGGTLMSQGYWECVVLETISFFFFYTSIRCPEGATEVLCLSGSEARVREPEPEAPAYGALQRSASCVRGELFTGMLQDILLSWYWMLICADEINHILKQSIVVVFLLSPMFIYFTACSMNLWVSFTSYLSGVG